MNYALTILTNGRLEYLARTLRSFGEHVHPFPRGGVYCFDDNGRTRHAEVAELLTEAFGSFEHEWSQQALGQCRAQAHCWEFAAESAADWVFHIEDDQVFLRTTDLRDLSELMDDEVESSRARIVQMALVRCPWGAEVEFGGYIPKDPGWYERHSAGYSDRTVEWIETTRNWAHSPALYRTELTREFRFPNKPGCETTIGPMIRDRYPDAVFGLWGGGEPWYAHIGVERAAGAHGY